VYVNVVVQGRTITPGNSVVIVGDRHAFKCATSTAYSRPYWHYFSLTPGTKPCGFDSAQLYPGIPLCPSVPRISVSYSYSSTRRYLTTLTIINASLSDAGTYTCGRRNPNETHRSHAVIVGVIGKSMCKLHMHNDCLNLCTHCNRIH